MLRTCNLRRSFDALRRHRHPFRSTSNNPSLNPTHPTFLFCTVSPQPPPLPSASSDGEFRKYIGYTLLVLGCGAAAYYSFPFPENEKHKKAQLFKYTPLPEDLHTVSNWSSTHEVHTRHFLQPESESDLERVVKDANHKSQKIRPVGSTSKNF